MPAYVIQKHDASRLHYDFRLEVGGALRSWAVPKGPSTDSKKKRLAVPVEDHSLGWGNFEGVISSGYGAGTVIVWDRGTYTNRTVRNGKPIPMAQALELGYARFELEGEKLKGLYSLTRLPNGNWLLTKLTDSYTNPDDDLLTLRPESVLSGRTIEDFSPIRSR